MGKKSPEPSLLVSIPEAAKMMAVSYWTVRRMMRDGQLPRYGLRPRAQRTSRKAVLELIDSSISDPELAPPAVV